MNPETIRDYLIRAEMTDGQAEALSGVFAEMATKSDLQSLRSDLRSLEERMGTEFVSARGAARSDLAAMRADLTWKMIAIVGFFATANALFNVFVG